MTLVAHLTGANDVENTEVSICIVSISMCVYIHMEMYVILIKVNICKTTDTELLDWSELWQKSRDPKSRRRGFDLAS